MIYRVPGSVGSIAFGALLEIAIFFSALPKHSEDPTTPWQMIAASLLMPGGGVLRGLVWIFGHTFGFPLPIFCTLLTILIPFLVEAAILAVPFWLLARVTRRHRRSI